MPNPATDQLALDLYAEAAVAGREVAAPSASGEEVTPEIRHGDAFDLIESIDDGAVDLIITSPPYWGQRTYGLDHNWDILKEWEAGHTRMEPPPWAWYREHGGRPGSGACAGVVRWQSGGVLLPVQTETQGLGEACG